MTDLTGVNPLLRVIVAVTRQQHCVSLSTNKVVTQVDKRASRISNRARKMRTRVRDTRREIERIANTPTLGGLFLSFLKIGTVGFGGGLAVIAQIRTLAVQQRRWLTEQEFASGFALGANFAGHGGRQYGYLCGPESAWLARRGRIDGRLHSAFDADDDRAGNSLPAPALPARYRPSLSWTKRSRGRADNRDGLAHGAQHAHQAMAMVTCRLRLHRGRVLQRHGDRGGAGCGSGRHLYRFVCREATAQTGTTSGLSHRVASALQPA